MDVSYLFHSVFLLLFFPPQMFRALQTPLALGSTQRIGPGALGDALSCLVTFGARQGRSLLHVPSSSVHRQGMLSQHLPCHKGSS